MQIVYDEPSLREYFSTAARVAPDHPVLIDRFLETPSRPTSMPSRMASDA